MSDGYHPLTNVWLYRLRQGGSVLRHDDLAPMVAWGDLSDEDKGHQFQLLRTRAEEVPEDYWQQFTSSFLELSLCVSEGFEWIDDLLGQIEAQPVSIAPGDVIEADDYFLLVVGRQVWRPLPGGTGLVRQLYAIGRNRTPAPPTAESPVVGPEPWLYDLLPRVDPVPLGETGTCEIVQTVLRDVAPDFESVIAVLPEEHHAHVHAVIAEYARRDLQPRVGPYNLSIEDDRIRALDNMFAMAVMREAIVTVAYRQDLLGPALRAVPHLGPALVRIWDDEVYHEVYLRSARDAHIRDRFQSMTGRFGGYALASLFDRHASRARRLLLRMIMAAGRVIGAVPPEAGRRPRSPEEYCAHNVALEVTAYLGYQVLVRILQMMSGTPGSLRMDAQRLSWKISYIANQELQHAAVFAFACSILHGADAGQWEQPLSRFARLVHGPRTWGRESRLSPGENLWERTLGDGVASLHAALDDVSPHMNDIVRAFEQSKAPSICIQCDVPLDVPLADSRWTPVTSVLSWLASWCAERSISPDVYIVDAKLRPVGGRHALTVAKVAGLASVTPIRRIELRSVAQRTKHLIRGTQLSTYGKFYSSDADLVTRAWWAWTESELRISLFSLGHSLPVSPSVANLRALVTSMYDITIGDVWSSRAEWVEVPGLRDVAALRLLGAHPPDLSMAICQPRSRGPYVVVGGVHALSIDLRAAELMGIDIRSQNIYAIATLID